MPITAPVRAGALDAGLLVQADYNHPVIGTVYGQGVLTRAMSTGAAVREGDAPFEFDLTPQVILQGERPMVRPMRVGTTGADAAQLNAALARLGQPVSATSNRVSQQTLRAWAAVTASGRAVTGAGGAITQIEVNQIAFVPTLPVRVGEVSVLVGSSASGPVAQLTSVAPQVFVTVGPDAAPLLPNVPTVEVISPLDQTRTAMKVSGRTVANDGSVVLQLQGTLPPEWQGSPLRARISSLTQDEPGLLVPRAALSLISDGRAQVRVWKGDTVTAVQVDVLAFDRSDARVTGHLQAGDLVVIAG